MTRATAIILMFAWTLTGRMQCFAAAGAPLSVQKAGTLLNIPAARLRLLDETANFQRRKGQAYLNVVRFTRDDGLVTDLWIETTTAGKLWTETLEADLAKYPDKRAAAQAAGEAGLEKFDFLSGKRISFGADGQGHIGMSWDGPRGACFRALVTLPHLNRDVALSLCSSEQDDSSLEPADKLLQGQIATNYSRILKAGIDDLVSRALGRTVTSVELPWVQAGTNSVEGQATQPSRKSRPSVGEHTQTEAKESGAAAVTGAASGSKRWLLAIGCAALGVIAWFLVKGRLR